MYLKLLGTSGSKIIFLAMHLYFLSDLTAQQLFNFKSKMKVSFNSVVNLFRSWLQDAHKKKKQNCQDLSHIHT